MLDDVCVCIQYSTILYDMSAGDWLISINTATANWWYCNTDYHNNNCRLVSEYGDVKMKCGEDDDGYSVKTKLKHFLKYLENNQVCSRM
jgi:hypothetical protein